MLRHRMLGAALAASALALAACTPQPEPPATAETSASASVPEALVENLDAPWSIVFHDGAALVSERDSGRVLEVIENGEVREIAVIDGVSAGGEGGLLGLAVHQGELYTYFTAEDENRIERREIRGTAGSLTLGTPTTVIDGIPAAGNHNGGRIAFGPDGMLYATTGDAGSQESAQDVDALSGKILRLTPEGACRRTTPSTDLRCTASGTATRRASGGMPTARCMRASSGRTPGMS